MADEQPAEGAKPEGNVNPTATDSTVNVVKQADNPDAVKNALDAERKAAREAQKRAEAAEAKVREFEDASASEVEKLTKRAERAEQQTKETNARLLRFEVGAEKKVHPDLQPLLTGTTRDELEAQAALLLDKLPQQTPDFDGGVREPAPESKSPEEGHRDLLLRAFGRTPT